MIYINPEGFKDGWGGEVEKLAKIQIDNSLALGWKPEDIMLVTNFNYEYNGIKPVIIGKENYFELKPTATKIMAIVDLFDKGLIGDDLYWFHDFDVFQLERDIEPRLEKGKIGITDYGITRIGPDVDRRWSTGIIFFRKDAQDVFKWIKRAVYSHQANEEISLLAICRHNRYNILDRIQKLNITYNLATRKRDVSKTYEIAEKPLKIIHFHPFDTRPVELGNDNIGVCVYGKNKLNKVLVSDTLIKLFKKHEII